MDLPLRLGRVAALALSALMLVGCAARLDVSSYAMGGIDVRQYRTFAWRPVDRVFTGDPRLDNNRFFDERVRAGVEAHLSARGFEKTTSGAPDLQVHYHASFTQAIDARDLDRAYGICDEACRSEVHEAGTLLIDLVDTRSNRVIWRGWAEGTMDGVIDNQDWMEKKVNDAITRILEKLPNRL